MGDSMYNTKMDGGIRQKHDLDDEITSVANILAAIGDSISDAYGPEEDVNDEYWLQIGISHCVALANALIHGFLLWQMYNGPRRDEESTQQEARNNIKIPRKESCDGRR